MFRKLISLFKSEESRKNDLENYITLENPKNISDVEFFEKKFLHASRSSESCHHEKRIKYLISC